MDPRAGLDRCGKSRPPHRVSISGPSVASRYTDYTTRPTSCGMNYVKFSQVAAPVLNLNYPDSATSRTQVFTPIGITCVKFPITLSVLLLCVFRSRL